MLFYYQFNKSNNIWIRLEGEGKNPSKCKNIKWSSNKNNNDLKIIKDVMCDMHPGYGTVLNYQNHLQNLYVQTLKFSRLSRLGYKHQEDNFIPFSHDKIIPIKKAERTIQVKGSSKVKAHKRRIKISKDLDRLGDKEKVTKGIITTDYKESVKNMDNYISNLNQTDEGKKILKSMTNYTMNSYKPINNYMKDPASLDTSQYNLDNIKDSITNIEKFISDAPKFKGKVYRGLQYVRSDFEGEQRWDDFVGNIEDSKEIKFGSFLSTSSEKMVGVNFATKQHFGGNIKSVLISIKIKSGVSIESISQVKSEHEVILDANKTYKIIEFFKQDERNHFLELEEI